MADASSTPLSETPSVSVVIPVHNESRTVAAAVMSALRQEYEGPLEIVVADGMSSDGTSEILEGLAAGDPRVRIVENRTRTTSAGLNRAIEASSGEVIVRLDGHSVLPAGYVRRAVEVLRETRADNVGGIQDAVGDGFLQRAIALAMSIPIGVGDARFHRGGRPGPADTVYLGVFRRSSLDRVGLFDERLERNQDYELNFRIRKSGGLVFFDPTLRVTYRPRSTLPGLWRQYFDYGAGKRRMLAEHPGALRWRQLAPPALVLGLVASLGLVSARRWFLGALLPALYVAALSGSAVVEGVRRREFAAVALPIVLPIMHIAWGLGFLLGPFGVLNRSGKRG